MPVVVAAAANPICRPRLTQCAASGDGRAEQIGGGEMSGEDTSPHENKRGRSRAAMQAARIHQYNANCKLVTGRRVVGQLGGGSVEGAKKLLQLSASVYGPTIRTQMQMQKDVIVDI